MTAIMSLALMKPSRSRFKLLNAELKASDATPDFENIYLNSISETMSDSASPCALKNYLTKSWEEPPIFEMMLSAICLKAWVGEDTRVLEYFAKRVSKPIKSIFVLSRM